jgi:lipoprotein signal peptidase
LGGVVALIVFAADQSKKVAMLAGSGGSPGKSTPLAPFLDLALRWNRGISFSLLVQDSVAGRMALLGLTFAAITLLVLWLCNCRTTFAAAGLGAIIGGAFGNAFDRLIHGAVVDYLDLHPFGRHLFVFNLADAAINIGVMLLAIDLVFGSGDATNRKPATSQRSSDAPS